MAFVFCFKTKEGIRKIQNDKPSKNHDRFVWPWERTSLGVPRDVGGEFVCEVVGFFKAKQPILALGVASIGVAHFG